MDLRLGPALRMRLDVNGVMVAGMAVTLLGAVLWGGALLAGASGRPLVEWGAPDENGYRPSLSWSTLGMGVTVFGTAVYFIGRALPFLARLRGALSRRSGEAAEE